MVYFLSVDGAKLYVFSESTPIFEGVFSEITYFLLIMPPQEFGTYENCRAFGFHVGISYNEEHLSYFTIKDGYLSYLYSVYLSVVLGEVPL